MCLPWKRILAESKEAYLSRSYNLTSVQFSHSVVSNSLQPHGLQHARIPCPSPTPGACSNSCPSSCWCHPTISYSIVPFSSCLQSFAASGSFPVSQFIASGGQSIGVSASASVLPMNIQDWFPLGWAGWISSPRDSQASSPTPQFKRINSSVLSFLYSSTLTSIPYGCLKCLPTRWETQVQSLVQEDPLEKEMATDSSVLAWRIPWMEEPVRLQSRVSQRVGFKLCGLLFINYIPQ